MDVATATSYLLGGTLRTLAIFAGAAAIGLLFSVVVGLARSGRSRWLRWPAMGYIEIFRGTSAFVQIFWFYYALPLAGIELPGLLVAMIAVGINTSAYGAEIVRGAISAVPRGQREAARALGLTAGQRMRHVILPQAIPAMIPPFGNLLIEALKNSALAMAVGISELFFTASKTLRMQDPQNSLVYFGIILGIYFAISLAVTACTRFGERRLGAHLEVARG